jgi:hypothetical protein
MALGLIICGKPNAINSYHLGILTGSLRAHLGWYGLLLGYYYMIWCVYMCLPHECGKVNSTPSPIGVYWLVYLVTIGIIGWRPLNGWSMEWSVKKVFTTWPEKTVGSDCLSVMIGRFQSDRKELKQQRATSSDSEFGKLDPARPTRG